MKKIIAVILALIQAFAINIVIVRADNSTLNISINESNIIKESAEGLFGYNDYMLKDGVRSLGGEVNPVFENALLASQVHPRFMRLFLNSFDWEDAVGEIRGAVTGGTLIEFGIVEYIKFAQELNPNVSFDFVISPSDENEKIKNFVRFLTLNPDDKNAYGDDGVNYPEMRIRLGIDNPVNVELFEIGNESDMSYYTLSDGITSDEFPSILAGADEYSANVLRLSEAIKSVNSDAKTSSLSFTVPHGSRKAALLWNERVIGLTGAYVDYIVHHYYYGSGKSISVLGNDLSDRVGTQIQSYIDALNLKNPPKIFMSEHAVYATPESSYNAMKVITKFSGALKTAGYLNYAASDANTELAVYHTFIGDMSTETSLGGSGWGAVRPYKNGEIYVTAAGEVINLMSKYAKGSVVKSSIAETKEFVNCSAYLNSDGKLTLILVNNDSDNSYDIDLQTEKSYTIHKKEIIIADADAENKPSSPNAVRSQLDLSPEQKLELPASSIVVYEFIPKGKAYEKFPFDVYVNAQEASHEITVDSGEQTVIVDAVLDSLDTTDNLSLILEQNGNIKHIDQCKVVNGKASFSFPVPKERGEYLLKVGNATYNSNFLREIALEVLDDSHESLNIEVSKRVFGEVSSSNRELAINVTPSNNDFYDEGIRLSVYYGSDISEHNLAYVTETDCIGYGESFDVLLPTTLPTGEYTAYVSPQHTKPNASSTQAKFVLNDEDEILRFKTPVYNSDGNYATAVDLKNGEIIFKLENLKNEVYDTMLVLAVFDENNALLETYVGTENVKDNVEIKLKTKTLDDKKVSYGKVFVFEKDSIQPLTDYAIIR